MVILAALGTCGKKTDKGVELAKSLQEPTFHLHPLYYHEDEQQKDKNYE